MEMEMEMDTLLEKENHRHQQDQGRTRDGPPQSLGKTESSSSMSGSSSSVSNHHQQQHQHHPQLDHTPTRRMMILIALVISSCVRAHQAVAAASETRTLVLTLPIVEYATFSLASFLYLWKTIRFGPGFGLGGTSSGSSTNNRNERWLDREEKRDAVLLGCLSAVVAALNLWEARLVDPRLWQAAEITIVPLLIVAPTLSNTFPSLGLSMIHAISLTSSPSVPPRSPSVPPRSPSLQTFQYTTTLAYILSAITFLVSFSFIGIAGMSWGVAITLLRLPLEGLKWCLLRKYLANKGVEKLATFLMATAIYATAFAMGTLICSFILPSYENPHSEINRAAVTRYILSSIANTIFLVLTLQCFVSALIAASTLVRRNLILLLVMSHGEHGISISGNWLQMAWILTGGWVAILATDPIISAVLGKIYNQIVKGGGGLRLRGVKMSHRAHEGVNVVDAERGHARKSLGNTRSTERSSSLSPVSSPGEENFPPQLPTPTPNGTQHSQAHSSSKPHSTPSTQSLVVRAAWFSLLPLLICLLQGPTSSSYTISSIMRACTLLPPRLRSSLCPATGKRSSRTVDMVFAYHEESLDTFRDHLKGLREEVFIKERENRALIYNKGGKDENELRKALQLEPWDQVIQVNNLGREGGTYLRHILLNYNQSLAALNPSVFLPTTATGFIGSQNRASVGFADHTYFMQPHLAWHWIAKPRIELMRPEVGFAHFGPLQRNICGKDQAVQLDFPIVNQLYGIFTGQICSTQTGFLSAWSAQFAVSKQRILANAYQKYSNLNGLMEAPAGHWIHDMWGPNDSGGPSNPALGHSVERAWPLIFGCTDPTLADRCTDEVADADACQCLDVVTE